jgi:hypothetical protein
MGVEYILWDLGGGNSLGADQLRCQRARKTGHRWAPENQPF